MSDIKVVVARKTLEAAGICSFELRGYEGRPLPAFSAGSHIDVHIRDGLVRQYSLCNNPSETFRYLLGVLREPESRGGSEAMHDEINEGDIIKISEPRNNFPLTDASRTLLFAGGIGVTPILSMAESLSDSGADFEMHYCSRSPERMAFQDYIRQTTFSNRVFFHFDDGADEQKLDLTELTKNPDSNTHVYVCGPKGFIDYVMQVFEGKNWPPEKLHVEYFSANIVAHEGDESFEIVIASTGAAYTVPADKTVYAVLEENGIGVEVSCEQGICGTCLTPVLEGTPDHRDMYLTEEEHAKNDQFTPCCSRSKSPRLVLDL